MAGATSYIDVICDAYDYSKNAHSVVVWVEMEQNYGLTRKDWRMTLQIYDGYKWRSIRAKTLYGYTSPTSASKRTLGLDSYFPHMYKDNSFRLKFEFRSSSRAKYGSWATNYSGSFVIRRR
ncbi:hypothetical protein [Priestia megaterium]|uniref:hypothetical protein n=1 Tax=Priestia megaterium TaxID=1404 RepID=UPI000BEB7158|nr:hypothetical protein [Priestia megaterium]PED63979.1 hypothetical protein CON20_23720 [Priestia megaterium]